MQIFYGSPASPGLVTGPALVLDRSQFLIPKYWLHQNDVPGETTRFQEALDASRQQLQLLHHRLGEKFNYREGREHLLILESHMAMLNDATLRDDTENIVRKEKINAEWALAKVQRRVLESLSKIDEEYFRERQHDVAQVIERIQRNLLGKSEDGIFKTSHPVVLVARDLSPADLAQLPRDQILGLVAEVGGRTSHTGIIASAMGIPAVLGLENVSRLVRTGDRVILDGVQGVFVADPTPEIAAEYHEREQLFRQTQASLLKERDLPQETADHRPIDLAANLELLDEIPYILQQGGRSVGLFRTEMFFMKETRLPTEEEQTQYYSEVLKRFSPQPVTMRTYDFGGDKVTTDLPGIPSQEMNPALGLRAIRLCLQQKDLFVAQLRAMLRASIHGNLRIMIPFVSELRQIRETKEILAEVQKDLLKKSIPFKADIPLGVMIETPAAVLLAEDLAREVTFFSVGTNDLIQYTLAVDRTNEHISDLFNPLHPAITRFLSQVQVSAQRHQIDLSLCGEMASDPLYIPILIHLGFRSLSLNAVSLPRVKHILRELSLEDCNDIGSRVLSFDDPFEAQICLKTEMVGRFPDYFHFLPEPPKNS